MRFCVRANAGCSFRSDGEFCTTNLPPQVTTLSALATPRFKWNFLSLSLCEALWTPWKICRVSRNFLIPKSNRKFHYTFAQRRRSGKFPFVLFYLLLSSTLYNLVKPSRRRGGNNVKSLSSENLFAAVDLLERTPRDSSRARHAHAYENAYVIQRIINKNNSIRLSSYVF